MICLFFLCTARWSCIYCEHVRFHFDMSERDEAALRRLADELTGRIEEISPGLCFVDKGEIHNGITDSLSVSGRAWDKAVRELLAVKVATNYGLGQKPRRLAWLGLDVQLSYTTAQLLLELDLVR